MTEPVEGAENAQTAEGTEAAGRRGRPRPDVVVQRDEQVYESVVAAGQPVTRKQVAETSGIKESLAYLSLLRLRTSGRLVHVRQGTAHVWAIPGTVPLEATTESADAPVAG